jgi:hypothetical protein
LPPDKKEEYKKMFPEPVYLKIHRTDKSGYMWIDQELLEIPESWISKTNIIKDDRLPIGTCIMGKIETYSIGAIVFIPEYPGDSGVCTEFCNYMGEPEEKKLINIRYKNIRFTRNLLF